MKVRARWNKPQTHPNLFGSFFTDLHSVSFSFERVTLSRMDANSPKRENKPFSNEKSKWNLHFSVFRDHTLSKTLLEGEPMSAKTSCSALSECYRVAVGESCGAVGGGTGRVVRVVVKRSE